MLNKLILELGIATRSSACLGIFRKSLKEVVWENAERVQSFIINTDAGIIRFNVLFNSLNYYNKIIRMKKIFCKQAGSVHIIDRSPVTVLNCEFGKKLLSLCLSLFHFLFSLTISSLFLSCSLSFSVYPALFPLSQELQ